MATEIQLVVTATSNIDKKMAAAEKSIKKMGDQSKKTATNMETRFKAAAKVVEGVMGAAILKFGANAIKSQERLSLSMEILKVKSKDVYEQLQNTGEATFGLANKFDMVNAANKAMSFGIDLSNGRLEKLMKLAAKTSVVMGTDVKSAFDDLVTGVARESKMILDNLGVMVDLNKIYGEYAAKLGISAKELTKAQRQTALLDEVNIKLAESTAMVTDEMVNQATQGTQAIKDFETATTYALNIMVKGYVGLGKVIGETTAKTLNIVDKLIKDAEDRTWRAKNGLTFTFARFVKDLEEVVEKTDVQKGFIFTDADAGNVIKKSKKGFKKLRKGRELAAKMVFSEIEVQEAFDPFGLDKVDEKGKDGFDLWLEKSDKFDAELQSLELDAGVAINDLVQRNADQRNMIRMSEYQQKKALREKEKALDLKHFNILQQYGSEYLNAIITGQLDAIPKILANQAMMFGQQIFWDGLKTMWFGISDNTIFPGLGANKMQVGIAEMGIGAGLMTAGGVASNALSSAPSTSSGSKERNNESAGNGTVNMNVTTSLYGSKTQAKKELIGVMN